MVKPDFPAIAAALLCVAASGESQQALPVWNVTTAPSLVIESDGTHATEFTNIVGAARLSNGSIAVADATAREIRVFDPRGRHLHTFGRAGAGPGEFNGLGWIGRSGDTLFFFDSRQQRITSVLFVPEPLLLATTRVTAAGGRERYFVGGRLDDGRWMVETVISPRFDGPTGVHRLPGSVGHIAPAGDGEVTWLGEFESMALFVYSATGKIENATVGPIAFSPALFATASGSRIWFGDSAGDSLLIRDIPGARILATVRVPISRRSPSAAAVDLARRRELEAANRPGLDATRREQSRAWTNVKYSERYLPRQLPYFQRLIPAPRGEVWVQEYAESGAGPVRHVVMGPDGRARARVSLPPGLRVVEVGPDYVLAVYGDEDGVESLRLYHIDRR